jgi:hypothetical protein
VLQALHLQIYNLQGFGLLILIFCILMIESVSLSIKIIVGMAELIIRVPWGWWALAGMWLTEYR